MYNKRGDIFSIWIVMITLFMAGIAITSHVFQQGNLDTALVSSDALLKFEDRVDIYEQMEKATLKEFYCLGGLSATDVEGYFVNKVVNYAGLFFEEDLYYNGDKINLQAVDEINERISFLYNAYSFSLDSGILTVARSGVVRKFSVESDEKDKLNFIIGISVSLDKEYILDDEFC